MKNKKVHLIGIGGSGMLSLANLLVESGFSVSGSDIIRNEKFSKLEEKGVKIFLNHNPKNILDSDIVIYSSAIKPNNVELIEAKKLNKEIFHRVDFIKKVTENKKTIGIAGTHGKTTTTAMISYLFKEMNLSPSLYFGGENDDFYFGSEKGTGEYFILETDEHDKSFLNFNIHLPVVTNIDRDHLTLDGPFKGDFNLLKESFLKFINNSESKKVILSYDCPNLLNLIDRINKKILSYSIEKEDATLFGKITKKENLKTIGEIFYNGKKIGELNLSIPGEKYFLNSLGVILISIEEGFNIEKTLKILEGFKGVKRRFEIIYDKYYTVIDDHADHPTEIGVTLKIARDYFKDRRIISIIEPHRYSRVKDLYKDYPDSFKLSDIIILLPVDPADETITYGVSTEMILEEAKKRYKDKKIFYLDKKNVILFLKNEIRKEDVIIFMGPGKIKNLVKEFLIELEG
ncbi:MAG: UDP-N-acetylmuramate--L-alanine ligase [Caldisericia bacterium]